MGEAGDKAGLLWWAPGVGVLGSKRGWIWTGEGQEPGGWTEEREAGRMSLFASQLKASLVPLGGIKHYQCLGKGHLSPESLETSSQDTRVLKSGT